MSYAGCNFAGLKCLPQNKFRTSANSVVCEDIINNQSGKCIHHFGCAIRRLIDGTTIEADKLLYAAWSAADAAPANPSFAMRARLVEFDTENSVPGAKGTVYFALTNAKAEIESAS